MVWWLHISDLHMKNDNDADQQNFCGALLKDCIEKRIHADFVVATGDFHNFWDSGQYSISQSFLQKLMKALGLNIQTDLFIIPGNHDVEAGNRKATVQKFLSFAKEDAVERLLKNSEKLADYDYDYAYTLTKHPELLRELLLVFNDYREMAGNLLQVYQEGIDSSLNPADIHVRNWNNRINILHLNTAILSDGNRGHTDAVDINLACSEQIKTLLNNGLPTIVIGHHSFHDLHSTIKERLVQLFNQTNVWAYLAGDKHRTNYRGDEFLIYRKTGTDAWPNIIASKMAASTEDNYSEFGAVLYCWDEHNTATFTYLQWTPEDSGKGMTKLEGDAERYFPMFSGINSQLYYALLDRLIEMRDKHPSFQLMKIEEELFPKAYINLDICKALGEREHMPEEALPLSQFFQESWNSRTQNHLMLEGEGGIGKTIALLSITTQEDFLPRHVPAVYIPLHALKIKETDDSIGKYIREEILYENEQQYADFKEMVNQPWERGPRIILLLDGFNEVPLEVRYAVARNIEDWSNKRGIQLVTACRFDIRNFLPGLSGDFRALRLQPLSYDQIQKYFGQMGLLAPSSDSSLWTVINYPLMLALYTQTELHKKYYSFVDLDWREAQNAGTVLWNYLQRELWRCQKQTGNRNAPIKYVLATEWIAPYIAWTMVKQEQFLVLDEEFCEQIQKALEYLKAVDRSAWPRHVKKIIYQCGGMQALPDAGEFFDLLTRELNLFRISKSASCSMIGLMHQRFRDCLAAVHLLNLVYTIKENELPKAWQQSIDFYVMNFVAELISSEEADRLWEVNRKFRPTNPIATRMMLELQKRIRNYDFSELNFSGMDLRNVYLYGCRKPNSIELLLPQKKEYMENVQISENTFESKGHKGAIKAIAITPDGKWCVSVSDDRTLRIWDLVLGDCLHILEDLKSPTFAVAITPNGKCCIGGSIDGVLRIWDIQSGKCLHILEDHKVSSSFHSKTINCIAITSDGNQCVSACSDTTLRIWDMQSGKCLHVLEGHTEEVYIVVITPDGERCVSGSQDRTLRIWNMQSGECLHILEGNKSYINTKGVAITPDGKYCVSASPDRTLRIWDMQSGECLHILEGHKKDVCAVSVTVDGNYCVSASADGTLRIWDMYSGECRNVLEGHKASVFAVSITSDGNYCVSASWDSTLRIWDIVSGKCLHVLEGHTWEVYDVVITPDGNRCISASLDSSLRIWDMRSGLCLYVLEGQEWVHDSAAITPDGRYYTSVASDGIIRIWDMNTGRCQHILEGDGFGVYSVVIMSDGKKGVSVCSDDSLRIFDIASGIFLQNIPCYMSFETAITPDGKRCVIEPLLGTLCIWDMESGRCLNILKGHKEVAIWAILFTPDGKRCISACADNTLRIWDMVSGKCLHVLEGHISAVCSAAITPDGKRCVSGSLDKTLRIWDTDTGECLKILEGHNDGVNSVDISPDGKYCISIANGLLDTSLRIWDIQSGECIKILTRNVNLVEIAPDGIHCVSGSFDGTLHIWNMKSGECLHTLKGNGRDINSLTIPLSGKYLISAFSDGIIRIWDMKSGKCLKTIRQILGLNLFGVDLSDADITPSEYAEILDQNGLIIKESSRFTVQKKQENLL